MKRFLTEVAPWVLRRMGMLEEAAPEVRTAAQRGAKTAAQRAAASDIGVSLAGEPLITTAPARRAVQSNAANPSVSRVIRQPAETTPASRAVGRVRREVPRADNDRAVIASANDGAAPPLAATGTNGRAPLAGGIGQDVELTTAAPGTRTGEVTPLRQPEGGIAEQQTMSTNPPGGPPPGGGGPGGPGGPPSGGGGGAGPSMGKSPYQIDTERNDARRLFLNDISVPLHQASNAETLEPLQALSNEAVTALENSIQKNGQFNPSATRVNSLQELIERLRLDGNPGGQLSADFNAVDKFFIAANHGAQIRPEDFQRLVRKPQLQLYAQANLAKQNRDLGTQLLNFANGNREVPLSEIKSAVSTLRDKPEYQAAARAVSARVLTPQQSMIAMRNGEFINNESWNNLNLFVGSVRATPPAQGFAGNAKALLSAIPSYTVGLPWKAASALDSAALRYRGPGPGSIFTRNPFSKLLTTATAVVGGVAGLGAVGSGALTLYDPEHPTGGIGRTIANIPDLDAVGAGNGMENTVTRMFNQMQATESNRFLQQYLGINANGQTGTYNANNSTFRLDRGQEHVDPEGANWFQALRLQSATNIPNDTKNAIRAWLGRAVGVDVTKMQVSTETQVDDAIEKAARIKYSASLAGRMQRDDNFRDRIFNAAHIDPNLSGSELAAAFGNRAQQAPGDLYFLAVKTYYSRSFGDGKEHSVEEILTSLGTTIERTSPFARNEDTGVYDPRTGQITGGESTTPAEPQTDTATGARIPVSDAFTRVAAAMPDITDDQFDKLKQSFAVAAGDDGKLRNELTHRFDRPTVMTIERSLGMSINP